VRDRVAAELDDDRKTDVGGLCSGAHFTRVGDRHAVLAQERLRSGFRQGSTGYRHEVNLVSRHLPPTEQPDHSPDVLSEIAHVGGL